MILMQKFGSAYIGGDSVIPGATYDFEGPDAPPISLGSTVPGKEVQWILVGGTLIADCNLILNVGWDYLNHFDLVFGKKIVIDGRDYKVRLLRAGREGRLSDWTNLLIVVRDQDSLLNWREAKSLGIDQDKDDPRLKICWGGDQLGRCNYVYFNDQAPNFGWRPVLELPNLNGGAIRNLIGKDVLVRSRKGITIEGIIGDDTDYDLFLYGGTIINDAFKLERKPKFLTFNQDHIVVNRAEVLAIHPWDLRLEVHP